MHSTVLIPKQGRLTQHFAKQVPRREIIRGRKRRA